MSEKWPFIHENPNRFMWKWNDIPLSVSPIEQTINFFWHIQLSQILSDIHIGSYMSVSKWLKTLVFNCWCSCINLIYDSCTTFVGLLICLIYSQIFVICTDFSSSDWSQCFFHWRIWNGHASWCQNRYSHQRNLHNKGESQKKSW